MRTPRKLTALVLMGALTASSVAAVPASAKTFSDVPSTHWAYTVIDEISNETIMVGVGDGLFSPETKLTRAEYTAILFNLAPDKANGHTYQAHLKDVEADAWYAEAAEWGVTHGIIFESDGNFEPNKVITRESMADMTYKYLSKYYPHSYEYDPSDAGYADQDQIDQGCKSSVNVLTHNGLLAGRGNNQFVPEGSLTRAEAAAMASRLIDVAEKAAAENPGEEQPPTEDPNEPEQPPVEEPENPGEDNPGEDNPSVDPDEPEQPPVDEPDDPADEEPAEDPSTWDLDGAPDWFLAGKPDDYSNEKWDELVAYWRDKEDLAHSTEGYPVELPKDVKTEKQAKELLKMYVDRLYNSMVSYREISAAFEEGSYETSSGEKTMISLVNKERANNNIEPLITSPALNEAAEKRAKEIISIASKMTWEEIQNTDISFHTRPGGLASKTILGELDAIREYATPEQNGTSKNHHISYSENLTLHYGNSPDSAQVANNRFMNSSGHRANLLNKNSTYVGVGFYQEGKYSVWVQSFARIYG